MSRFIWPNLKKPNTSSLSLTGWTNVINITVYVIIYFNISLHEHFILTYKALYTISLQRLPPPPKGVSTKHQADTLQSFISLTSGQISLTVFWSIFYPCLASQNGSTRRFVGQGEETILRSIHSSSTRQQSWTSDCSTKQSFNSIQEGRQANQAEDTLPFVKIRPEKTYSTQI